jgi:hypothetical protein
MGALSVHASVTKKEVGQPVPCAGQVLSHVLAGAKEIPYGLLVRRRHVDRRELAGSIQPHQLHSIAAVSLDPLSGLSWNQTRGNDYALDAHRFELALDFEAARARLVAAAKVPRLGEHLPERLLDRFRLVGDLLNEWDVTAGSQFGYGDRVLVDVQTNVRHLLHGRLLRLRL